MALFNSFLSPLNHRLPWRGEFFAIILLMEEILHLGNLVVYPLEHFSEFYTSQVVRQQSSYSSSSWFTSSLVISTPSPQRLHRRQCIPWSEEMQHSVGRKFLTTSSLLPRTILKGKGPSEPTITLQGIFVSFQRFPPKQRTTSQPHPTKTRPGKKNKMGPGCRSF